MDFQLQGKTVLITASSKGIGRAAAELFMKEGCKVAICSANKENLIKTASEMKRQYNIEPLWEVCNINSQKDIENMVEYVNRVYGTIDILVNNCGGPVPGFFEELNESAWSDAFEQVLMSAVRFTKLVLPGMKAKHWGRIVNITSISVKQHIKIFSTAPSHDFNLINSTTSSTFAADLCILLTALKNHGCQQVFMINHTKPEFSIPVVHVFIPQLKSIGTQHGI